MYCLNCGKQLPEEARFCMHCGAQLPAEKKQEAPAGMSTGAAYSYVPPKNIARDVIRPEEAPRPQAVPAKAPKPPKAPEQFCPGCGSKLSASAAFCNHCGQRIGAPAQAKPQPSAEPPAKQKKSKKFIIGWILVALQLLAMPMSISNGDLAEILAVGGPADFFQLLGYFLIGITGVCLLVSDRKKKK